MAASRVYHWLKISSRTTVEVQRNIVRNNIENCFSTKSGNSTTSKRSFDERLLDVLACPLSKKPLSEQGDFKMLTAFEVGQKPRAVFAFLTIEGENPMTSTNMMLKQMN